MTRQEHLMVIAIEECAEVSQRLSKALRFGLEQIQRNVDDKPEENPDLLTNRERIMHEFADLVAAMSMLRMDAIEYHRVEAKIQKVEKYLNYCQQLGTLTE